MRIRGSSRGACHCMCGIPHGCFFRVGKDGHGCYLRPTWIQLSLREESDGFPRMPAVFGYMGVPEVLVASPLSGWNIRTRVSEWRNCFCGSSPHADRSWLIFGIFAELLSLAFRTTAAACRVLVRWFHFMAELRDFLWFHGATGAGFRGSSGARVFLVACVGSRVCPLDCNFMPHGMYPLI